MSYYEIDLKKPISPYLYGLYNSNKQEASIYLFNTYPQDYLNEDEQKYIDKIKEIDPGRAADIKRDLLSHNAQAREQFRYATRGTVFENIKQIFLVFSYEVGSITTGQGFQNPVYVWMQNLEQFDDMMKKMDTQELIRSIIKIIRFIFSFVLTIADLAIKGILIYGAIKLYEFVEAL